MKLHITLRDTGFWLKERNVPYSPQFFHLIKSENKDKNNSYIIYIDLDINSDKVFIKEVLSLCKEKIKYKYKTTFNYQKYRISKVRFIDYKIEIVD